MTNISDIYKTKAKRPVDPNAPPRPNLMSHEKVLKDTKIKIDEYELEIRRLQARLMALEDKMTNQTAFLNALYQTVNSRRK